MSLSRADLQKAYAEKARTIGKTGLKSAFAETVIEMIEPNRLTLDVVRYFMKFENLSVGDNIKRQVRKGKYNVRSFVPGQDLITQRTPTKQDKYLFFNDWIYCGVSEDLWAIEQGDVDSVERMRSDLAADIIETMALQAFTTLTDVWTEATTPDNYYDASSGGLTATILDAAIEQEIKDIGGVRAIVGTRTALLPVYRFSGYREVTHTVGTASTILPTTNFQEYENTLKVSTYHGVPLVELPNTRRQRLPNLKEFVVPTNKLLVIGTDPGTFYAYGGTEYQENTDTSRVPGIYNLFAWQRYTMLIDMLEAITLVKTAAVSE